MTITKTQKIIIAIIIIVVLFGLYLVFDKKSPSQPTDLTEQTATTTSGDVITTDVQGSGYRIEPIPVTNKQKVPQPIPNLSRLTVFSTTLSPETRSYAASKIIELQSILKENPADYSSWMNLGLYQKMAGDYGGAVISWGYASRLAPTDYTSLGNLGNLHAYFLGNFSEAEDYYKQAISKGPTQSYLYVQLAEVYRDLMKDTDKALVIVEQGLSKIPNDPSLLQLQTSLK